MRKIYRVSLVILGSFIVQSLFGMERNSSQQDMVPGCMTAGVAVERQDISVAKVMPAFDSFIGDQIQGSLDLVHRDIYAPQELCVVIKRLIIVGKIIARVLTISDQEIVSILHRHALQCSPIISVESIEQCFSTKAVYATVIEPVGDIIQKSIHERMVFHDIVLQAKEAAVIHMHATLLQEQKPFVVSHEKFLESVCRVRKIIEGQKAKNAALPKEQVAMQEKKIEAIALQESNFALMQIIIDLSIEKTMQVMQSDIGIIIEGVLKVLCNCH